MKRDRTVYTNELKMINNDLASIVFPKNSVFKEIYSFINGNSKRIRSILGILYLKMNNLDLSGEARQILVSAEIIHNASLLHDDVIDNACMRRNKETLALKFNPHVSILSGDYLISIAIKKLMALNNPQILRIFLECTQEMSKAEINQYQLRNKKPEISEYIEICRGKTSSLFGAVLESLAVLYEADNKIAKKIGGLFGLIFQMRNDIEECSAKKDSENGIITAKDIIGIEKTQDLTDNYKEEILSIIKDYPENIGRKALEDIIREL